MALIDVSVRIQALAYLELGYTPVQVKEVLRVSKSVLYRFRQTVIERGYKLEESKKILLEYLVDTPRSGRLTKVTQVIEDSIVSIITKNLTT
jgi:ACT domain-containing protein